MIIDSIVFIIAQSNGNRKNLLPSELLERKSFNVTFVVALK